MTFLKKNKFKMKLLKGKDFKNEITLEPYGVQVSRYQIMEAKINGTGRYGSMKNEIVLNVFDAMAIRDLVKEAIKADNKEKYHSCDRKHWEDFLEKFNEAFIEPQKLEDEIL